MHKLFGVLIASLMAAAPNSFAQTALKKPQSNVPQEVEPDFYGDEEPPPEEEEAPTIDEDPLVERSESPDDEGIQYADEAEKHEAEDAQKAEETRRRKARARNRPPVDEPMPLIRRQREKIEFSNKVPTKRIRHPFAAKGLTKITREKTYIYRVKESDQKKASSMRFGPFTPTKLENTKTRAIFEDFYPSNNPALLFDYEWQIFSKFGKLGLTLGSGVAMASGNGQFATVSNGAVVPQEKFTFVVFPNSAGAILRFQFMDNQIFVPYVSGGGTAFLFGEFRDDGGNPKFGGAVGGYAAAGLNFSLDFLDDVSMLELDREYSINNIYLTAEFRKIVGVGTFNFTSDLINGGVTIEF